MVRLQSFGDGGYRWEIANTIDGVELIETRHEALPVDAPVGGSGDEVFTFRATKPVQGVLKFELRRPWEDPGDPAAKTLRVTVSVGPAVGTAERSLG